MYIILTKDCNKVAGILKQGRLVAFPTGTSYGLAADTRQGHALQRLSNLKTRPANKSYTVCLSDQLFKTYLNLNDLEQKLITAMSGQPLTLLVQPKPVLAHVAKAGLIGLRLVDHPMMRQLVDSVDFPITATSANRAGQDPCFSIDCIKQVFPGLLPDDLLREEDPQGAHNTTYDLSLGAILDAGTLPNNPPTTIAKLVGEEVEIIRPGSISQLDIQKQLGI